MSGGHDHFGVLTSRGSLHVRSGSIFIPIVRRNKRPAGIADFTLGGSTETLLKIIILDRLGCLFEAEINLAKISRESLVAFRRVRSVSNVCESLSCFFW